MNWSQRRKRAARRRRAARGLAGGIVGIAAVAALGWSLPEDLVVSERALLARPPEVVWRVLLDLDGMPLWRSDLRTLERLPDRGGRPAWRETGPGGERVMVVAASEPPFRLVLQPAGEGGEAALGTTTFELTRAPGGVRLTVTERARVRNPLRRVLHRVLPPRAGLARLLRDLELRLNPASREVASGG